MSRAIARDRKTAEWQTRPLCCEYSVVLFEALPARMVRQAEVRGHTIHVGFGVHASGTQEVLGVWIRTAGPHRFWRGVFEELKNRGVERMRVIAASEPQHLRTTIDALYPGTALQPSWLRVAERGNHENGSNGRDAIAKLLPKGFTLSGNVRRSVMHAIDVFQTLNRRKTFSDEPAVVEFVRRTENAVTRGINATQR